MATTKSLQKPLGGATIKDYLTIIARRRWLLAVTFLSVMVSTVFYVYRLEDNYESYSTMVIEEKNSALTQMIAPGSGVSLSFYEGILNSRSFAEMVLDSIGLDVFKSAFPRFTRDDALGYLQSSVGMRKTSFTSFFQFHARSNSRELAYLMASIGTEIFRRRCQEVSSEESRRAMTEIQNQLQVIRKNLETAEQEYRRYSEKTGHVQEGTTPELKTLQEAYSTNLAQLGVKEADLDAEKKQLVLLENKIAPASSRQSPEYLRLRSKLRELEKEHMRLEGMGIRFSGVSTIDREIQEIENQLLQYKKASAPAKTVDPSTLRQWQELRKSVITKEGDLELFKQRLESYRKAIASYKKGNPDILSQSLELLRLKRSKEVYENTYNILLEKAEEERIRSASRGAGVHVVDIATLPSSPIPKNENRFYILGILIGLGLGLGLAFFIEFNDTSLKSTDDIEKHLGLPVLGTIPHIVRKNGGNRGKRKQRKGGVPATNDPHQLFSFEGDDSVITESYRSLRTNLTFVSPDKALQTILITSSGPGEGKSLTISNLAMAYAQMGKRTLLIDTDLRRPVLHHIFGEKREPGFSDLFMGEQPDFEHIIRKTPKQNLFLIPAGIFTPNPAELLGSYKMERMIDFFRTNYDVVFFDTPPVVAVTDSTLLGTKMDGLLLVIKSHHTDREMALWALNSLRKIGIRILGTVFNDIDLTHRYSSYGYYKYYYHYYKSKKS
ncbi:MAG: polysaccharide biosynthesis tyrosine autokinase [Chitinispirillaceae bacterium]|nr:polysaccharide biosynthesis tyrosine autokinase [Chitinispirillaceae bacterium]